MLILFLQILNLICIAYCYTIEIDYSPSTMILFVGLMVTGNYEIIKP